MATRKLPSGMTEKLGHYVYLYIDPVTKQPFYVGKGKGNRAYAHLNNGRDSKKTRHRVYFMRSFTRFIRVSGSKPLIRSVCKKKYAS